MVQQAINLRLLSCIVGSSSEREPRQMDPVFLLGSVQLAIRRSVFRFYSLTSTLH